MQSHRVLLCLSIFLLSDDGYSQKSLSDTAFLYRYKSDPYHAIFIDKKNSVFYDHLKNNKGNVWDSSSYNEAINALKSSGKSFTKNEIKEIPRDWRPLYLQGNSYYVYAPSEWGSNSWIYFTDSTLVEWVFDDGTQPSLINSFKKIKQNHYRFILWNDRTKSRIINVFIIDPKRQIAIFEDATSWRKIRFLMVAANTLNLFPIIINYCKDQKVAEFDFDKPDFEKLLRNFK